VGAEQAQRWTKEFPIVNLIGPTAADVRDIMVQGIGAGSAIMEVCPKEEAPVYEKSNRRLVWPNGAVSFLFSAEEPERLRGPQHMKLWCDEIAAWRNPEACWEQAEFGLRPGAKPQTVITTTPKPTRLIKQLANSKSTHLTQGTTYDNRSNLAPAFLKTIIAKYEGTRLGRQELNAEILEDRPGALWALQSIEADRVLQPPSLRRIVVGVDPAMTNGEESNEWGIVCVAEGASLSGEEWPPHYYVLDDLSHRGSCLQNSPPSTGIQFCPPTSPRWQLRLARLSAGTNG
jgi:phage terminase large subunit-like protein